MADTKKYGLIIKKKISEKPLKKSAVFGNESSDEEDAPKSNINVSLMREAQKKKQMKQTQLEIEKALKEDPSVYEYDKIYDEMSEKKKAAIPKLAEKDRKPKYIKGLLESAKSRKMEDERRMERKIQKEREQEGGEFQEKEEFVTSAYRKRMIELQEEEERIKKQEALDAANDVTKRSDLTMFYSNLLKHNVSMGGSFAVDNKTDSIDNDRKDTDNSSKDNSEKKNKAEREDKSNMYKESSDSRKDSQRSRSDREGHRPSSSRHHDSDRHRREYERRRTSSEERSYRRERSDKHRISRKESEESSRRHSENRRDSDSQEKYSRSKHEDEKSEEGSSREERTLTPKNETKIDISAVKEGEEAAVPSKFVKRSNNESISSARERFLERKRAREMQRKQEDSDED